VQQVQQVMQHDGQQQINNHNVFAGSNQQSMQEVSNNGQVKSENHHAVSNDSTGASKYYLNLTPTFGNGSGGSNQLLHNNNNNTIVNNKCQQNMENDFQQQGGSIEGVGTLNGAFNSQNGGVPSPLVGTQKGVK
jgi:hypothetical protein